MNINRLLTLKKGKNACSFNRIFLIVNILGLNLPNCRCINTTSLRPLIQKWREERGLPENPNAYGVLTDKPDYTYLDGRPTPLGIRQKGRIMKHQELTNKIIELTREVDFAVDRHAYNGCWSYHLLLVSMSWIL